jgi:hypothetical protein
MLYYPADFSKINNHSISSLLAHFYYTCLESLMKTPYKIFLFVLICVLSSTVNVFAQQKRAQKTSSAKAYYGQTPSKPSYKSKNTKTTKAYRSQSSKRARTGIHNRKKYVTG